MLSTTINELESQSKKRDILLLLRNGKLQVISDVLDLKTGDNKSLRDIVKELKDGISFLSNAFQSQQNETLKLKEAIKVVTRALELANAKIEQLKAEVL